MGKPVFQSVSSLPFGQRVAFQGPTARWAEGLESREAGRQCVFIE